ncbi:hypothetical protein J5I95_10020 [Candidatus Poribacteria bacterium]|nr:hypothetical protein [Candidatus Poribacteria bacterium]
MELPSGSFGWAPQLPRAVLRCLHLLQPISLSREHWLIAQVFYEPTCLRKHGAGHRAHYGNSLEPIDYDRYFRQVFPVSELDL